MRCQAMGIIVAGILLLAGAAHAQDIDKWTKPDGTLYFGTSPPPGSTPGGPRPAGRESSLRHQKMVPASTPRPRPEGRREAPREQQDEE
jgi:hypothetical protein